MPLEALRRDELRTEEFFIKAYLAAVNSMDCSTERLQAETNQETVVINYM